MTEINKNLSVNGLNFEGLKHSKKPQQEEEKAQTSEAKETDLDKMPGAAYGRAIPKIHIKGKYDLSPETTECIEATVRDFKKDPDIHVIADMVFQTAYEEALEEGCSEDEAYSRALEAKEDYLSDIEEN